MTATQPEGLDMTDKKTLMRGGFEAQRKAGMNVDWFTWQIAWHDALFQVHDIAGDALLSASKPAEKVDYVLKTQAELIVSRLRLNSPSIYQDAADIIDRLLAASPAAPAQSAQPVAEVIKWRTLTGHTAWDFKVFDKTLEHGAKLYTSPQPSPTAVNVATSMTNGDFHCPACGNVMKGPTSCGSCLWEAETCGYKTAVVLDDERAALRDMLEDARAETAMIREALGVPYEPHQTLLERTLDAARAASPQQVAQPVEQTRALTDEQVDAITTALSLIGLSGDPRVRSVHKTLRALLTAARPASGETE